MKLTTKKIVIAVAVFFAFVALYGYTKAKTLIGVFEKMTILPNDVSNIDISLERIKFNLDILLSNKANDDFDVSGYGLVTLKEVKVFYNNVYLATSTLNITGMVIPAQMNLIVEDIPVEIPKPLQFFAFNLPLLYGMIANFDPNKITVTATIDVAGNLIEI